MRVKDGIRRSDWTQKHGPDHTYGGDDKSVSDHEEAGNQRKRSKGATRANILCSGCGSSIHKRPTHRDCPFNSAAIVDSEGEESSVTAASSSEPESDFVEFEPPTGDLCTCGSSGRTHKRECPLSLRKRFPRQRALPSSDHVPIEEKTPSPTQDVRPHLKVGDHVCVHSRFMGSSHLPCRIVREFDGCYQLYCAKGVLMNSFCAIELTPLASGSVISLERRKAPKVSLRSASDDTTLIICTNCNVPSSFDCAEISSASEGESEAPDLWVNCGAYTLSRSGEKIILSPRGWLTDNIVSAAQTLLLQFHPRMTGLQPPALQKVFAFRVHSWEFVQIVHVRNIHLCVVSTVGCDSRVICVYDSV